MVGWRVQTVFILIAHVWSERMQTEVPLGVVCILHTLVCKWSAHALHTLLSDSRQKLLGAIRALDLGRCFAANCRGDLIDNLVSEWNNNSAMKATTHRIRCRVEHPRPLMNLGRRMLKSERVTTASIAQDPVWKDAVPTGSVFFRNDLVWPSILSPLSQS